ncbi:hypothetical protein [Flavobacterium sp.]|uniref:hypothetical protein n=1 Tax=Flavobacterium sp. TaxID=239 RepID=UPI0037512A87
MKKFVCFFLLTLSTFVFGQNFGTKEGGFQQFESGGSGMWVKGSTIDNTIEGSSYLFEEWDGVFKIFTDEMKYYPTHNLNYNIRSKVLESKISKDSVFQYDLKTISFIKRGEEKYVFYTIQEKKELCLELYSSNKIVFIKDFKLFLINGTLNPLTQEKPKSRYEKKQVYFFKVINNEFHEIYLKKKSILKLFGDKSKLVDKYASDSNLKFSSEKDLCEIFKYYDSL